MSLDTEHQVEAALRARIVEAAKQELERREAQGLNENWPRFKLTRS